MKFYVQGMSCSHCVGTINKAIHALDPDARVDVDLGGGTVTVEGSVDPRLALAAIEAEGYGVSPELAPRKSCCGCR